MTRTLLILACLLVPATALAQRNGVAPGALDLSVPQAPLRYLDDPSYQDDAPGTFYGDHDGPRPRTAATADAPVAIDDKLQVHGAVSTGIGHSKAFGNSHWSSADINLGKNYNSDEGKTRRLDLNIHVSQGKGIGPYGDGPGPWYGW